MPTVFILLFTNATCDSLPLLILIVFHKVRHPLLLRFTPLCHPPFPSLVQCPLPPSPLSPCSPFLPVRGNFWPPDGNTGVGNLSRRPAVNLERSRRRLLGQGAHLHLLRPAGKHVPPSQYAQYHPDGLVLCHCNSTSFQSLSPLCDL